MKCRICGYEYDASKARCPMCGTRAEGVEDQKITWDTKDFPQPKKMEDIEIKWTSPDASEGYVSVPYTKKGAESINPLNEFVPQNVNYAQNAYGQPQRPVDPQPAFPKQSAFAPQSVYSQPNYAAQSAPAAAQPAYAQPSVYPNPYDAVFSDRQGSDLRYEQAQSFPSPNPYYDNTYSTFGEAQRSAQGYSESQKTRVPRVEEGRLPENFYTFKAKNEEFQKLLDEQFERLHALQGEQPKEQTFFGGMSAASEAKSADAFEKMIMNGTKDKEQAAIPAFPDASPVAPKVSEEFDIHTLEHSIQVIEKEEEEAQKISEERRRKLAAMAAARDAYFKKLDEEAEKEKKSFFANRKQRQADTAVQAVPAEVVQAVPADAVQAIPADAVQAVPTDVIHAVSAEEEPKLEDLTGELSNDPEHTVAFVKEDFLAAQTQYEEEYAENEREDDVTVEESSSEEISAEIVNSETVPDDATEISYTDDDEENIPDDENSFAAALEDSEAPNPLSFEEVIATMEKSKKEDGQASPSVFEERFSAEVSDVSEQAMSENSFEEKTVSKKKKRSHPVFRFFLTLIVILVVFQAAIWGLYYFFPQVPAIETAHEIGEIVQIATNGFFENVIKEIENFISVHFN